MPIYEFECRQCGNRFETLVRESTKPSCPSCQGTDLARLLSAFAVGSGNGGSKAESAACSTCPDWKGGGGGCCSMN
jgi:putative FmdB family regulatory protein